MAQVKVMFVNHAGGGFADYVLTDEGTTLGTFIRNMVPDARPEQLVIRVNNDVGTQSQVLRDGDRVTTTPTNLKVA